MWWRVMAWVLALTMVASGVGSITFLWFPGPDGFPRNWADMDISTSADELNCIQARTRLGIINATQAAMMSSVPAPDNNQVLGFAIYNEDATVQVTAFTMTENPWPTSDVVIATGITAFTLTSDTLYWYCWCSDGVNGDVRKIGDSTQAIYGDLIDEGTTAVVVRFGKATNDCTSGVPPALPGGLSDVAHVSRTQPPLLRLGVAGE